jgi:hypothetical protein
MAAPHLRRDQSQALTIEQVDENTEYFYGRVESNTALGTTALNKANSVESLAATAASNSQAALSAANTANTNAANAVSTADSALALAENHSHAADEISFPAPSFAAGSLAFQNGDNELAAMNALRAIALANDSGSFSIDVHRAAGQSDPSSWVKTAEIGVIEPSEMPGMIAHGIQADDCIVLSGGGLRLRDKGRPDQALANLYLAIGPHNTVHYRDIDYDYSPEIDINVGDVTLTGSNQELVSITTSGDIAKGDYFLSMYVTSDAPGEVVIDFKQDATLRKTVTLAVNGSRMINLGGALEEIVDALTLSSGAVLSVEARAVDAGDNIQVLGATAEAVTFQVNDITLKAPVVGVESFNGRDGIVLPESGDYPAEDIPLAAIVGLTADNVQAAIEELLLEVSTPNIEPYTNTHTTDGITATWTLAATPVSKSVVTLNLNGNEVLRDDYTLDGADVTLSYVPPAGWTLDTKVLAASEIAEPGPETVDFATLTTISSELALMRGALDRAGPRPFRWNYIYNGGFRLNTREQASYTAAGYTVDRWKNSPGTGASVEIYNNERAPGASSEYELVWERSVAGSAPSFFSQRMLGVRTLAGEKATIYFRATADANTQLSVQFVQNFGSGGDPSNDVGTEEVIELTAGVESEHFIVVDVDDIAGATLGTFNFLELLFKRNHDDDNPTATVRLMDVATVEGDASGDEKVFHDRGLLEDYLCAKFCRMTGVSASGAFSNSTSFQVNLPHSGMIAVPDFTLTTSNPTVYETGTATRTGSGSTISVLNHAEKDGSVLTINGFSSANSTRPGTYRTNNILLEAEI